MAATVQLRHIRSANQLTGLLHFTEIFESEGFQKAVVFIEEQLPPQLQNSEYIQSLTLPNPDRRAHPELVVCDFLEQQGSYVKFGMIDKAQYIDVTGAFVTSMWQQLREVIAIRRVARNSAAMYENFEYLASLIQSRGAMQQTATFPHGIPRLMAETDWRALGSQRTSSNE